MSNYEEFADLNGTGINIPKKETIAPEDEFLHSIYICGMDRKNHKDITELNGKLQIRGVDYNLDDVNMIILLVRKIRVNKKKDSDGKTNIITCGSKLNTNPWTGTSGRKCPSAKERLLIEECKDCKHQIVVIGMLCDNSSGRPRFDSNNKPIFCFFVGRGIKWADVNQYLVDEDSKEITPIFTPVSEKSLKFEKENIGKSKRVVTNVGVAYKRSPRNNQLFQTFKLTEGIELSSKQVLSLLEVSKKILPQVDEKLDRIVGIKNDNVQNDDDNEIPKSENVNDYASTPMTETTVQEEAFDFDDIPF